MAKARLTTKSDTVIMIEGTPDEVANLISQFEGPRSKPAVRPKQRQQAQSAKGGIVELLLAQIEEGFFKKPAAFATGVGESCDGLRSTNGGYTRDS